MLFFTYISNSYACSNNLQKAIHQFLKLQERLIIPAADIENFKKGIIASIVALCKEHPRCIPVDPYWWSGNDQQDYILGFSNGAICNFHIYHSAS